MCKARSNCWHRLPFAAVATAAVAALPTAAALASFHMSVIEELMTSYAGDGSVQFIEIRIVDDAGGTDPQGMVRDTVLGAFDVSGSYLGDVLVVPGDVANGMQDDRWIMATSDFEAVIGLEPDFVIPDSLPASGGMVCWGAPPGGPPPPGWWPHDDPDLYTDCLAYGGYTGPSNRHIGNPEPAAPNGYSLQRSSITGDNAADFECSPPTPENNAGEVEALPQTSPCFFPSTSLLEIRIGALPPLHVQGGAGGSASLSLGGGGDHILAADGSIWAGSAQVSGGGGPLTGASVSLVNEAATFTENFLATNPAGDMDLTGFGGSMPLAGSLMVVNGGTRTLPLGTDPYVAGTAVITGILTNRVLITNGPRAGETGAPFTLELAPGEGTTVLVPGGITGVTIFGDAGGLSSVTAPVRIAPARITLVTPLRIDAIRSIRVPASISLLFNFADEFRFIPEPSTALLLGAGAAWLALVAYRRRSRS